MTESPALPARPSGVPPAFHLLAKPTAAAGLGAVIGPLLGGWLYDRIGALSVFSTAALFLALGAGLILLFLREPSKS